MRTFFKQVACAAFGHGGVGMDGKCQKCQKQLFAVKFDEKQQQTYLGLLQKDLKANCKE